MDELDEDMARARQAAQVILDGVTASDPAADDGVVNDAMQVAFGRLLEIGAIELTAQEGEDDDEEDEDVEDDASLPEESLEPQEESEIASVAMAAAARVARRFLFDMRAP